MTRTSKRKNDSGAGNTEAKRHRSGGDTAQSNAASPPLTVPRADNESDSTLSNDIDPDVNALGELQYPEADKEMSSDGNGNALEPMGTLMTKEPVIAATEDPPDVEDSAASASGNATTDDDEDHCELVNRNGIHWGKTLQTRVKSIIVSDDVANHHFNIFTAPRSGYTWKSMDGDSNSSQHLVLHGSPPRFWIVGEVAKDGAWLIGNQGAPLKSVSIALHPLRKGEFKRWSTFLNSFGGVRVNAEDDKLVASRRMIYKNKGETTATPLNFEQCFDASKKLEPYNDMSKLSTSSIGVHDLVQMEVLVTRWMCDAAGKTTWKTGWNTFRVGLELVAVSILFSGPDDVPGPFLADTSKDTFAF